MLNSEERSKIENLIADIALEDLFKGLAKALIKYAETLDSDGEYDMAAEHRKVSKELQSLVKKLWR